VYNQLVEKIYFTWINWIRQKSCYIRWQHYWW